MPGNIKIYIVEFNSKILADSFHKIGITHHFDVLDRFKGSQYDDWDIRVVCSAYGPRSEVEQLEKLLLIKYPKNIWIEKKISGVTEIVNFSSGQLDEVVGIIKTFKDKWYNERNVNEK